ncbi:ATP-binding cassette domain-containing protein [Streptomyces sp. CBMA291]|uniref:ATP-binding cassette domain-containing protein n=1 Tax=Streptomyces sp. CBMA291 TaxID=1930279 RepID=UPI00397FBB26
MDDLTFEARPGAVTALLGPPGSGKTTTLRLMLELEPGRGVTYFRGRPLHGIADPPREVGVLLGDVPGHPSRTLRGQLRMLGAALGVPTARADELARTVGLAGLERRRIGTLPIGADRRLGLASALLGDPHTLLLDEPGAGLSPAESAWLHELLRGHTSDGGTVLYTTDDPKDAARHADRVVTLDGGRLVADQDAVEFARTRLRPRVSVRTPQAVRLAAVVTQEARAARRPVEVVAEEGNRLSVYGSDCAAIGDAAFRHGVPIHRLTTETGDMGPLRRTGSGATGTGKAATPGKGEAKGTVPRKDGPGATGGPAAAGPGRNGPGVTCPETGGFEVMGLGTGGPEVAGPGKGRHEAVGPEGEPDQGGPGNGALGRVGPGPTGGPTDGPAVGSPSGRPSPATTGAVPPSAPPAPSAAAPVTLTPGAPPVGTAPTVGSSAASTPVEPDPAPAPRNPVRAPLRPLRYELHRLLGVPSTPLVAGGVLLLSLTLALLLGRGGRAALPAVLAGWPAISPLPPAALGAGLLGAFSFGEEYRYPALTTGRGAVPRRPGLLLAKLAVSALVALGLGVLVVLADLGALRLVHGAELVPVPENWSALAASWLGLLVGCAWAGVLGAGVFRAAAAGVAAVLAVPVAFVPLLQKVLTGPTVRSAAGLPARLREFVGPQWSPALERWLAGTLHVLGQPAGVALTLTLAGLSCAYVFTGLRRKARW